MSTQVNALARYSLNAKASQFFVHAFATGLISVAALNPKFAIRDFSGEASFQPPLLGDASLSMKIRASSLEIMDEVSADDRKKINDSMFGEVLQTSLYPEIRFKSTKIEATKATESLFRLRVTGNLTLHGVTRVQEFDSQVMVSDDGFRAYGDFTLNQTNFGIQIASVAGGTLKMKDEVRFSFFLIGQRQGAIA
jgi:polyisoprenoid-binding protein YceI